MTPRLAPVSRDQLIRRLKDLGFDGPFTGGKHAFMIRGETTIRVPNPHGSDIGADLLGRILRQAQVSREEWFERQR